MPDDLTEQCLRRADELTGYGWGNTMDALREAAAELSRLRAIEQKHADLMTVVVQPWTRDGDGAEMFKINLSWWDTADTEEKAHAMIAELVGRVKARRGKA